MLRLGVAGGNHEGWRDVARRLRGAALDLAVPAQASACEGLVLLGLGGEAVEWLLAAGKHVLLADEAGLSEERLAGWSALVRPDGPRLALLNPDRFLPSRQLVRQQLDRLGEPGLVRVHR